MIRRSRKTKLLACALGLVTALLGLSANPVAAAPSFEIDLDHDANEIQAVGVNAAGGQFRLNFGSGGPGISETGDLAFNASPFAVEAALNALSNVADGGGSVRVKIEEPTITSRGYFVTFAGGPIAHVDVPELIASDGTVPLSGGLSTGVSVSTLHEAGVSRGDERIDYVIEVRNSSSPPMGNPVPGDRLTCVGAPPSKAWDGVIPAEEFGFEWRRNGALIPSVESETYVTTADDAGKSIQCLVSGTNSRGDTAVFASMPAAVVDPQPVTAPPASSNTTSTSSRPTITNESGEQFPVFIAPASVKRFCHAPANWTPGTTYEYQWLLNRVPIAGAEAETAEYQPVLADESKGIQCEVIGTNAGGSVVGISDVSVVGTQSETFFHSQFVGLSAANTPVAEFGDLTSGLVTIELELPGGQETFAFKAQGKDWSCNTVPASGAQSAKAICTRSDFVKPEASYPPIRVITRLGADAPDTAVAKATVFGGGALSPASDETSFVFKPAIPFGLSTFEAAVFDRDENDYTQAGGHPYSAVGNFIFGKKRHLSPENEAGVPIESARYVPIEHVKQVITDLPRGFVGNALALPELCPSTQNVKAGTCPPSSQVGELNLLFSGATGATGAGFSLYAIEPEFGTPAQFAFEGGDGLFTLSTRLRPEEGYAISLELSPSTLLDLLRAKATICNFGVKLVGPEVAGCKEAGEPGANPKPLFSNPTRCGSPPPLARAHMDSWQNQGAEDAEGLPDLSDPNWKTFEALNPEVTGCENVKFEPQMSLGPTSSQADSPTGLDVELTMPTDGLEEPEGISQANLKRAKITFPQGMAINAAAGHGLGSCSAEQVKLGTNKPISCPDSSKIGSVEIETPILERTLKGDVFIAEQGAVEGALSGLYLVFESKRDGILVKIPGRVDPQPNGQLVVTVDESPEAPFSSVRMHFPGGPRATLLTPPKCGTYEIKAELSPWSALDPENPSAAETVTDASTFEVTEGPNGAPCPSGALDPKLSAGSSNPLAAKTSPFVLRLSREDGTERFSALGLKAPAGLTAYLKGLPYCPDAVLASISERVGTGQGEIDNPSCPAASRIGTVVAGAGAGSSPLYVDTGKAYLAGPYKGAPLSIAVVAPAVAGPLDLGTVVVRNALRIDPETAQVSVISDPIPTMLHGIILNIRDVRVAIDRPGFTLNPTSCEEKAVGADVKGESGASASLSNRFQVGGCEGLGFKPTIGVRLIGGTKRGGHPALRGVLTARPGDANIARAAVTIPRSEFLDQGHIRTICTRVQFAAKQCPKGSVYGHATATTPLLDYPVRGPVYLRSSSNKLPDLVVALRGPDHQPIEAVVVGRIDSIKGQIRTTFENAPDVPITKFVLSMQGGRKGLLINSRDVCAATFRATVKMEGHNGMRQEARPALRNGKCGKGRTGKSGPGRNR